MCVFHANPLTSLRPSSSSAFFFSCQNSPTSPSCKRTTAANAPQLCTLNTYILHSSPQTTTSKPPLHQLQAEPRPTLLPPRKDATKVDLLHAPRPTQPRRIPPLRRARTRPLPPPLLTRLARKSRKHLRRLGTGVFGKIRMLEHVCGRGPGGRVEGEEGGEEVDAGVGEEGELGADEGGGRLRVRALGQAEGFDVGEAAEGGPGFVGGEAAEFEDLVWG